GRVHAVVPPWTKFSGKYRVWTREWWMYTRALFALRNEYFDLLVSVRVDPREIAQMRFLRAAVRAGFSDAGGVRWLDVNFGAAPSFARRAHKLEDAQKAATVLT